MNKVQTIEDFYQTKLSWVPPDLHKGLGHFNLLRFEDFDRGSPGPTAFSRKEYYKISLVAGRRKLHYADQTIETGPHTLLFSNPQVPYTWEPLGDEPGGSCCIFTPAFLHQFGNWQAYPVFQPTATPVLELTPEQAADFQRIYDRMLTEIRSTYIYKYDALKNLVLELVHGALKLQPTNSRPAADTNAAQRLTGQFLEALEQQFPVDNPGHRFQLRSASDFAGYLSVHVNHLNKALGAATGKTTSELIAERVLREAKILLKHTTWNVSEIAYSLGFKEVTHFNNFFRKHAACSPTAFRVD